MLTRKLFRILIQFKMNKHDTEFKKSSIIEILKIESMDCLYGCTESYPESNSLGSARVVVKNHSLAHYSTSCGTWRFCCVYTMWRTIKLVLWLKIPQVVNYGLWNNFYWSNAISRLKSISNFVRCMERVLHEVVTNKSSVTKFFWRKWNPKIL